MKICYEDEKYIEVGALPIRMELSDNEYAQNFELNEPNGLICQWLRETCEGKWAIVHRWVKFELESDAMAFKLAFQEWK